MSKNAKKSIAFNIKKSFLVACSLIAFVGAIGIGAQQYSKLKYRSLYETHGIGEAYILQVSTQYESMKCYLTDMLTTQLSTKDTNRMNERISGMKTLRPKINEELDIYEKNHCPEELKRDLEQLKEALNRYCDISDKTADLLMAGNVKEALGSLGTDLQSVADEIGPIKDKILQWHTEHADTELNRLDSITVYISIILFLTIVVALLFAKKVGDVLATKVSKPVDSLLKSTNELADGNLGVHFDVNTDDELGQLADALNNMSTKLNRVLTNVATVSNQVSLGADSIAQSAQGLSDGATRQASAIEELTSSIENIATQTSLNAENAKKAKEFMIATKDGALEGNSKMEQMVAATNEIQKSSEDIANIIGVIDEIAFQTNILALNAAVEAARAGVHGKGFAVVADEVRNLAVRSAAAVKETSALIENSIEKTKIGSNLATSTAESLNMILKDVIDVTELIGNIATASSEQSIAINEINIGISQVSDVVQTTSATAQESAAASQELASQVDALNNEMDNFNM